ncbi:MAG: helix-turn-helix domain-containing protein [Coriobacteriales bacterium]|jgi:transcriptional regulator with XRE-family HTH domain|nr:helix-turn-helix domain-containing protein [Coriobacteriales bacterium]
MQVTLKQARQLRGLSQVELAKLTGFSEPTIVKYEKNELDMKVSTALRIADTLGVSFDGIRFYVMDTQANVGSNLP